MARLPDDPEVWLTEHLVYERWMLEYTYSRLNTEAATALWFAMFESFVVHARNLYYFVRGGDGNVQESVFVGPSYKKPDGAMGQTIGKFSPHVLHMGDDRATAVDAKANTDHANAIYPWLRDALDAFDHQLGNRYQAYKRRLADLIQPTAQVSFSGPATATNSTTTTEVFRSW